MIRFLTRFHRLFHSDAFLDQPCRMCDWLWSRLLRDEAYVVALEQGIADIKAGRLHKWSDVRREPGSVTYTVTVEGTDDNELGSTPAT